MTLLRKKSSDQPKSQKKKKGFCLKKRGKIGLFWDFAGRKKDLQNKKKKKGERIHKEKKGGKGGASSL